MSKELVAIESLVREFKILRIGVYERFEYLGALMQEISDEIRGGKPPRDEQWAKIREENQKKLRKKIELLKSELGEEAP